MGIKVLMENDSTKYLRMSFTTGGLFVVECVMIAEKFLQLQNWESTKMWAVGENIFQFRTKSSSERTIRECVLRLQKLDDDELYNLVNSDLREQRQIVWLSVCRAYDFIADFVTEVIIERYNKYERQIQKDDLRLFFEKKAEWHEHLDKITESTREKLIQVLSRLLRESQLITNEWQIRGILLSPKLENHLRETTPSELKYYPGVI